ALPFPRQRGLRPQHADLSPQILDEFSDEPAVPPRHRRHSFCRRDARHAEQHRGRHRGRVYLGSRQGERPVGGSGQFLPRRDQHAGQVSPHRRLSVGPGRRTMPLTPSWADIGLRLLLTVIAGALIGLNRGEHGHPAGLRTTLLVGLAASLSMILANLLLDTAGKPDGSFAVLDLMRLPLGILTGVGFIGAGAIIRRGDGVEGVTTAATLWFVTMVGLCLGGGQLILGSVATAIGLVVLIALKALENRVPSARRATIELILDGGE